MTDINMQMANLNISPTAESKVCPLCAAFHCKSKRDEYDELRRRVEGWADQLASYEADDAEFILHNLYDTYAEMVRINRNTRALQTSDAARSDIVRYHGMSYASFATHFREHAPTREARNVQKNDAIEKLYAKHLALMEKQLKNFEETNEDADLKRYNELIKSVKLLNDVSVSSRFSSFHTGAGPRKSIHK
jgi:hypothetical protein